MCAQMIELTEKRRGDNQNTPTSRKLSYGPIAFHLGPRAGPLSVSAVRGDMTNCAAWMNVRTCRESRWPQNPRARMLADHTKKLWARMLRL